MSATDEEHDADAPPPHDPAHAPHTSPVPPVGMILPGTVHVASIEPSTTQDGQARWRITLRGVLEVGSQGLGAMDCTLAFTTADPALIRQIRAQRYRYVLDLIQLQREGPDAGNVEDT